MLAVDTNIVVRIITGDDPRQAARARDIVDKNDVFVPTTVLLESEWVLRTGYRFKGEQLAAALSAFCGLPHVNLESADRIRKAIDWARQGMDFADALHLAAAEDCDAFVTFDEAFAETAKRLGGTRVRRA